MKLFSYRTEESAAPQLGIFAAGKHYNVSSISPGLPATINEALLNWDTSFKQLLTLNKELHHSVLVKNYELAYEDIIFLPPTTNHCSFRDFYAFLQHVRTARSLRGLEVVKEWFKIPVFYFSNPNAFIGHARDVYKPDYTDELDFELEIACIIGRGGKDIAQEKAHEHIAGFTILNDFSARDVQREEMKVGLGPAKSKDFASGLGPYLVTPDELETSRKNKAYRLQMKAYKNGMRISEGNFADIYYSFNEMIARASQGVQLNPGDVLGSGTVGSGCILELRPETTNGWLKSGDTIELDVEMLGKLTHKIV